jgi:hypothetical protein
MNKNVLLMLIRDKEMHILPDINQLDIRHGDQMLFAASRYAIDDLEYIAENIHELAYVLGN